MTFEVLDCLDSLVRLTKRTPTLDGSVPVRVARACVPLLEGNAFGFQLTLSRPLELRRRLRHWRGEWAVTEGSDPSRLHAGAVPRLGVEGLVPSPRWRRALGRGLVDPGAGGVRLFSGLLVKPEKDTWLRVTSAANRRNTLFEVVEQVVPDDGEWVPLVLEIRPRRDAPGRFRIEGEIACLAPLRPGLRVRESAIGEAPELAAGHASFYDRAYFETKKKGVTTKYRGLVASRRRRPVVDVASVGRVARIGTSAFSIESLGPFTTAAGPPPVARPSEPRRLDSIVFRNEVAFTAFYDGHTLTLDYDRESLRSRAAAVERAFVDAAPESASEHPGASLYLTKYFTPHPPGEPHFFVKPWAFTETPPGWSSLLDGIHGDGYDVMRGVVATDAFFATPAVFRIHREGAPVHVPEGRPLLRVIPVPRDLLGGGFRLRRL